METPPNNTRKWIITVAVAAGAALGAYGIAGAATSSTTSPSKATSSSTTRFQGNEDPTHEQGESAQREADEKAGRFGFGRHGFGGRGCDGHGNETVVTGATSAKIKAAALAAVPGSTVDKTEKRADGSYEAEITKADGSKLHLSLDKNFVVTSMSSRGRYGPPDGGADFNIGV